MFVSTPSKRTITGFSILNLLINLPSLVSSYIDVNKTSLVKFDVAIIKSILLQPSIQSLDAIVVSIPAVIPMFNLPNR